MQGCHMPGRLVAALVDEIIGGDMGLPDPQISTSSSKYLLMQVLQYLNIL